MTTTPGPTQLRDDRIPPLLWRLPLILFFIVGVACLSYLDSRLRDDYQAGAEGQASQMEALLEHGLENRIALVHALRTMLARAPSAREASDRFATFADELLSAAPELIGIYRLDATGVARDVYPRPLQPHDLLAGNHMMFSEHAEAILAARRTGAAAMTGLVPLRPDTLGVALYEPVNTRGTITGYVAAAIAYGPFLQSALHDGVEARFGYRLRDTLATVLAVSPEYPSRVGTLVTREIQLPGGGLWLLDVAIRPFQPRAARVVMWLVGMALLGVVFFLVVREDQRAERLATHSFSLEILSRDLLDANVRLEERAQQVTEANRAKTRFLANVSHELRTPINAILGYNSLALGGLYGDIPAPLRVAHDRIRAAADHLMRLVNDVLDLSKIEVGRMDVDLRAIDLELLLNEVLTVVEPVADAKELRVDLVIGRDLPRLTSDPRHVRQILLNLAANAIKFTERGSVTFVAKRGVGAQSGLVLVAVEDTGIGIAGLDIDRIFDEFEQVRPEGRGDSLSRGPGLGLTLARKLARLLGGDVIVESHAGSGSRFTLVLPIASPSVVTSTPEDAGEVSSPGSDVSATLER